MVFGMDRSEEVPAAARFDYWRELTIPKRAPQDDWTRRSRGLPTAT